MPSKNIAPIYRAANRQVAVARTPRKAPSATVHAVSARELAALVDQRLADVATLWPDMHFETEDGRTFVLIFRAESIALRLAAAESFAAPESRVPADVLLRGLGSCEVVIAEAHAKAPPMRFDTEAEGFQQWAELYRASGQPVMRSWVLEGPEESVN